MEISAVIFDLDGVLCSTDRYHFLAWKEIADSLGLRFDEELNDKLRGVSREESLCIILRSGSLELPDAEKAALCERKNARYRQLLAAMTPADVSGDVRETLRVLRRSGKRLAVGSSSKNTPLILARTGLADCFDAVADGNSAARSKPDPEVFLLAAALLGERPERCLVVEDSASGIEAARSGGFPSAGLGPAALTADMPLRGVAQLQSLC